ncbi:MAG: FAD-binding oxidoreductase, partial [Candidatus Magasanikbacteria bacterium]
DLNKNKFCRGYGITQPGAFYRDFESKAAEENLLMPSYPASRDICTVGGMVANNSGGEKTLKYGKTEDYVAELEVILNDGQRCTLKPIDEEKLQKKINQDDREGEIYQRMYNLVNDNYELLEEARPNVSKNSAGYYLWNVYDKEEGVFDLTQLFVGSQGTLGIIDKIKFRLVEPEPYSKLLVIFMKDMEDLAQIINKLLEHEPESLESYDDKTLKLVFRYFFDFVKLLGFKNLFKLLYSFLPEAKMVLRGGFPKLVMLAEFTGKNPAQVDQKAKEAKKEIQSYSNVNTHLAKSELEARKYWKIRRKAFDLIANHLQGEESEPFIEDLIVPPQKLPDFLPRLYEILDEYEDTMNYAIGGHSGDGNMHIYSLMDPSDPEIKKVIEEVSEEVYGLVTEMGGSITAEHNDGLVRSPFLEDMYGEEVYDLFEEVKNIFDPQNIFNPGKKVNADFDYSLEHFNDEVK